MRAPFLIAAFLLLGSIAWPSMHRPLPIPAMGFVDYRPLPLLERRPAERRLGKLAFLGAWQLTSNDWRLGGISALHVEGGEALAFSDSGWVLRFALPRGQPRARLHVSALPAGPGDGLEKADRDVEAAAVADGRTWLAFERANAVWRYDRSLSRREASAVPPAMRGWDENGGAEAMLRMPDGRFLVLAEGRGGTGEALLFDGDPAAGKAGARRLSYRPPAGYRITDVAQLPDGRLLFLNRRFSLFSGFSARLTMGAAGTAMSGEELARFEGPVLRDNLEALAVSREDGRTILWIASDDNYSALQRTLLMKFALEETPRSGGAP